MAEERDRLLQRGLRLEYVTLGSPRVRGRADLDPEVVKTQIEGVGALPFPRDHDPNRGMRPGRGMDDNDFYEDDEPIEHVRAAWKRGDKGVTTGGRDLNPRAQSVVDRAAEQWDANDEPRPEAAGATDSASVRATRPRTRP